MSLDYFYDDATEGKRGRHRDIGSQRVLDHAGAGLEATLAALLAASVDAAPAESATARLAAANTEDPAALAAVRDAFDEHRDAQLAQKAHLADTIGRTDLYRHPDEKLDAANAVTSNLPPAHEHDSITLDLRVDTSKMLDTLTQIQRALPPVEPQEQVYTPAEAIVGSTIVTRLSYSRDPATREIVDCADTTGDYVEIDTINGAHVYTFPQAVEISVALTELLPQTPAPVTPLLIVCGSRRQANKLSRLMGLGSIDVECVRPLALPQAQSLRGVLVLDDAVERTHSAARVQAWLDEEIAPLLNASAAITHLRATESEF